MRGITVVALDNPKSGENIGGSMRAAGVFGADLIVIGGPRPPKGALKHPTDTMKTWRHTPVLDRG